MQTVQFVLVSAQTAARKEKVYLMAKVSFSLAGFDFRRSSESSSTSGEALGRTGLYVSPRTMMMMMMIKCTGGGGEMYA